MRRAENISIEIHDAISKSQNKHHLEHYLSSPHYFKALMLLKMLLQENLPKY